MEERTIADIGIRASILSFYLTDFLQYTRFMDIDSPTIESFIAPATINNILRDIALINGFTMLIASCFVMTISRFNFGRNPEENLSELTKELF